MNKRNDVSDSNLVSEIKKGNSQAFALLISKYQLRIKKLGLSFFRNDSDAEDFVQDVFVKVYTSIGSFCGKSQFSTWLTRVAYNTAINSVKRTKEYLPLLESVDLLDTDLTPEEKQLKKLTEEIVRDAMKDIPKKFAICLDLYFFYDLSYVDISEILDLPINTVKSHIFRAKKLLKTKLETAL